MSKAAELAKIISASGVVSGVGFTAGNAVLAEAELELLDGLTAGTAIASKVITTDANIDSTGMRNLTISGELDAATLDISGNVDIDGTLETDAFSIASTAVTSTAAELNILDGVTSTAAELNLLDGVTSTTAELNILDGVTSTAAELNILDGVTSTAAELNILDGVTSTATELNLLDGVTSTTAELNILDGVTASATDINLIDGITNGTVIASKAIITDSNKDITGGRNITISGELDAASLDISGNIDVDGTTNLDVTDIDGAVDMASTLAVAGVVTANAGVVVDNITIDGTTIALSSGDLTLDVAGDITLDADGGDIRLSDGGTVYAEFTNNSSYLEIKNPIQDQDILIKGNDGGSAITALSFDMSAGGAATLNNGLTLTDGNLVVASGHGIDFSATANSGGSMSSELLDDYEEGSFTPVITFGGASSGITYASSRQHGYYTKVGNLVNYSIHLQMANKGSSTGGLQVTGLPFTAASNDHYIPAAVFIQAMASMSGGFPTFRVHPNNTILDAYQLSSNSYSGLTNSNCTNTSGFLISGKYFV